MESLHRLTCLVDHHFGLRPSTMPLDNSLESSVSNDLIDDRRLAGNAHPTYTKMFQQPNQDTASTLPRGMQTYVVPTLPQQAPRNACLPSQQIQVPPPTSTSRLALNLNAQGLGYLPLYQLGRPPGTSGPPYWCWPRNPDAKLYDDIAGADKLEMNRNRRIQGQKRFLPQRSELDIKTWDVRTSFTNSWARSSIWSSSTAEICVGACWKMSRRTT